MGAWKMKPFILSLTFHLFPGPSLVTELFDRTQFGYQIATLD